MIKVKIKKLRKKNLIITKMIKRVKTNKKNNNRKRLLKIIKKNDNYIA